METDDIVEVCMQMQTDDSNTATAVDIDPVTLDTPNNSDIQDPTASTNETSSFLVTTENIDDDNDQCVNCSRNQANIDDKSISSGSSSSSSTVSTATQPDVSRDESCLPSKANPTVIMNKIKPVTLEDLRVLTQCFYLPYEHGSLGHEMIQRFKWLKTHCQKLSTCKNKTTEAYMVKVGLAPILYILGVITYRPNEGYCNHIVRLSTFKIDQNTSPIILWLFGHTLI